MPSAGPAGRSVADYHTWASDALEALERELGENDYELGAEFSGADIMVGYTLLIAKSFRVLDESMPKVDVTHISTLLNRPFPFC